MTRFGSIGLRGGPAGSGRSSRSGARPLASGGSAWAGVLRLRGSRPTGGAPLRPGSLWLVQLELPRRYPVGANFRRAAFARTLAILAASLSAAIIDAGLAVPRPASE